jgi:hypothetical protein
LFEYPNVKFSWSAPFDQGSPITGYKVLVKQSDGFFREETTSCNMATDPSLYCLIPVVTLTASPYSLSWGTDVYAKVIAKNAYGSSIESLPGNGDKVITSPN